MVGSSKILTVSYGTFSCTLEGFDDSFSTMKAIAEYFRDLAADDRYFGAEPPTPDAEMLARIAEREVTHRVEARTGDNGSGVVLKAAGALAAVETAEQVAEVAEVAEAETSETAPQTDAAQSDAADQVEDAEVAETVAAETAAEDTAALETSDAPTMPPAAEAPAAPAAFSAPMLDATDAYEEDEEPIAPSSRVTASDTSEIGHPDADSVAAKLQRIRAVVSRSATPVVDDTQDANLAAETDAAVEDESDALSMSLSDIMSAEAEAEAEELAVEEDIAAKEVTEEAAAEAAEYTEGDAFEVAEDDAVEAEDEQAPVRARVIRMRRNDADETADDEIAGIPSDNDMADEADDIAEAVESAALVEDDFGTSFDDLGAAAEAEQEAEDMAELEKLDGDALAEAALSTLNADAEADLQAELAALNSGEDLYPEADPLQLDTPIADAVDEIAEATDDATAEDAVEQRPTRSKLPGGPDDSDSAMNRIMSETEAQMSAPDTSRRRDAIAQLKAAVAATEADREAGDESGSGGKKSEETFRDDLAQVVRPTRPIRPSRPVVPGTAERAEPAPLKLVPAQLVTEEEAAPAEVETAEAAPVADLSRVSADATGFQAFAQKMGAKDLADLLEAAAAYTSFVEGAEDFSRPQLMSKVKEMSGTEYSREEGLRAFGTLLREGQITKVRNGRFQVSNETRFHPERRAG